MADRSGEMLISSNLQMYLCTRRMQTSADRVKIGETLLMGAGDMKDEPIYQKDVECRDDEKDPTEQGGNSSSHKERGITAVNCQEVDMPGPAVQDPSVPSSCSTRPSRPKITRRPACLSNFIA